MPVNRDLGVVFVHIPKTGGTSIEAALDMARDWRVEDRNAFFGRASSPDLVGLSSTYLQHLTTSELHDALGEPARGYLWFCFVRNPWDRMVSTYHNPDHHLVETAAALGVRLHGLGFDEFVECSTSIDHPHLTPQHCYLPRSDESWKLDVIGRFETIEENFADICRQIGVDSTLPYLNRSPSRRLPSYRDYYSASSRQAVEDRYQEDCQRFGYEF